MKYKTTYFRLSLNNEISIPLSTYKFRIDRNPLLTEISQLEEKGEKIIRKLKSSGFEQITMFNQSPESLISIRNLIYEKGEGSQFVKTEVFSRLIELKQILESIDDQRYTIEDNNKFNLHLNEIASEGWKLHTINPITKGLFQAQAWEKGGYGFGNNVQEGFVLVWEKE